MDRTAWTHRAAGMVSALTLALGACAPIATIVDTPQQAELVRVSVAQPMQVRWANMTPSAGSWVLEMGPTTALKSLGRTVQPPANGAQQLEIFDFAAVTEGAEQLTFTYRRNDGAPPTPDERITIRVEVG
jgi:predicted secreted protein